MVREPQVGVSVTATVTDQDGGILRKTWQWSSAVETSDNVCSTSESDYSNEIAGATSFIYTPKTADINNCLRATARYVDNIDGDPNDAATDADTTDDTGNTFEMASEIMERPVQDSNAANTAPTFPDQDPDTAGDQSESATREIAENTAAGELIGEALQAQDANSDLLIHTLHGDDASAFSIDRDTGQLKTKGALDYETQDTYMVTVVATDPSGAMASIAVTIMVTDVDDPADITFRPGTNTAPAFTDFMVYENMYAGAAVGTVDGDDGRHADVLGRLGLLRCRRHGQHHDDDDARPRGDGESHGHHHGDRLGRRDGQHRRDDKRSGTCTRIARSWTTWA